MKMYFLLKIGNFQCHVSFQGCIHTYIYLYHISVNPKRSHQQQPQNCEAVFSQDHTDHSSNRQSRGDSGQIGLQLQKSPWLYQRDVLVHLQLAKAPLTTTLPPLKGSQSRGAIGNEVSQEVDTERSGCNDVPITLPKIQNLLNWAFIVAFPGFIIGRRAGCSKPTDSVPGIGPILQH